MSDPVVIPDGRVVRDPDDEGGVTLDAFLYGDAFVRGPIPKHWGELGRYVAAHTDLSRPLDDTILYGPAGR